MPTHCAHSPVHGRLTFIPIFLFFLPFLFEGPIHPLNFCSSSSFILLVLALHQYPLCHIYSTSYIPSTFYHTSISCSFATIRPTLSTTANQRVVQNVLWRLQPREGVVRVAFCQHQHEIKNRQRLVRALEPRLPLPAAAAPTTTNTLGIAPRNTWRRWLLPQCRWIW